MLGLILTLAIQATASMALLALPMVAPAVSDTLGLSAVFVGYYISIAYIGAVIGSLAAGTLVPRLGAIRASQFGLLLIAGGLALSSAAQLGPMLAGALLLGMGYGPITPASSHLLARTSSPRHMSLIFSLKQTGVPLGGMLAAALVPPIAMHSSWQAGILVVAAACALCALAAQPLRAALDVGTHAAGPGGRLRNVLAPLRQVWSRRPLRILSICSLLYSAVQVSLTTYLVTFLHVELGLTLVAAGLASSACQFAGVVGRIGWGWVADRGLGALRTLALLGLLSLACCVAVALVPTAVPVRLLIVLLCIFGAAAIGWNGVYLAELARRAPAGSAGSITGGASAITFLGVVAGPPLFGIVSDLTDSYRTGFAMLALPLAWCIYRLVSDSRRG
ncbi:Hexuronate transporter [Pigmentiphaga humi]|uniref:Hexuronate transporter n=1 Tax=Pigmentiphaga humi TaxID=2478468 RepID=A0A3P4AX57_9BURK|nr:MFS transporter [Pigmentiphaga humi]VCU68627.1 Hexuronate transporter [Pigmentiphaga humi]